jgi:hypothetical protein
MQTATRLPDDAEPAELGTTRAQIDLLGRRLTELSKARP